MDTELDAALALIRAVKKRKETHRWCSRVRCVECLALDTELRTVARYLMDTANARTRRSS